jgi:hypothetical protein
MIPRLGTIIASIVVVIAQPGYARISSEPLEVVIREASLIFSGKILAATPVYFELNGERYACGLRYRARVEKAFKGASKIVEFFDPSTNERLDVGERFLAFVFSYDIAEHQAKIGQMTFDSELLRAEYRCEVEWINLTVKEVPRTLLRFSEPFEGTDWLVVPDRAPLTSRAGRFRSVNGRNLADWKDEANEIERILKETVKSNAPGSP